MSVDKGADPAEIPGSRRRRAAGAVVSVYEDGPLIVRGQFAIRAKDGRPIPAGRPRMVQ